MDHRPPRSPVATRGMIAFQCLGGDCEDVCCGDWTIPVFPDDLVRLEEALQRPQGRALLHDVLDRGVPPGRRFVATIRLAADRRCALLDGTGLCALHRELGEEVLPAGCATYPRHVAAVDDRLELTGELSCPEVVRRCLLPGDGMELVPAPPAALGRGTVRAQLRRGRGAPYIERFDDVREAVLRLLGDERYAATTRLFFVAWMTQATRDHFFRETPRFDGERLDATLAAGADDDLLDELARHFEVAPGRGPSAALVTGEILASPLLAVPSFRRQVEQALAGHLATDGGVGAIPEQLDVGRLWASYHGLLEALPPICAERLDHLTLGLARDYWLRELYLASPDLFVHTLALLGRLAVLRFLIVSHPLARAAATLVDEEAQRTTFDRGAVEAIYGFCRAVDHSPQFPEFLATALRRGGSFTLATATALLKG